MMEHPKGTAFLKMRNAADILAVRFLSESGQMTGEFVQEDAPPWDVWWQTRERDVQESVSSAGQADMPTTDGALLKSALTPPTTWDSGKPAGTLKKPGWTDLFKKFVIREDPEGGVSEMVVIRTSEKATFFEIVRRHFLLQQGLIDFAVFQKPDLFWLIRIRHPSIWALDLLAGNGRFELYNQVPETEGIFIEAGCSLSSPANGTRLNKLHLKEKHLLLVQKSGEILSFSPLWNHGNSVVEINVQTPQSVQTDEQEKIVVTPTLRDTDETRLHELWNVEDPGKLRDILSNESMKRFSGYTAWFCRDRSLWLFSLGSHADRGLAALFSDAFHPHTRLEKSVFVPAGKVLSPRLAEERLKQIYTCNRDDFLILNMAEGRLQAKILPNSGMKKIDFFVTFMAENAVQQIESYDSTWTYNFPDVKKKE